MLINKKIPLITVSVLFVVMLAGSTINILNFRDNYREALLTGTLGAGFSLNSIVTELLALDLPLESLDGLDTRLEGMIGEFPHLTYVGIGTLSGKALFHSDRNMVGRTFTDEVMAKCAAATEPLIQLYDRFDNSSYHDVCIPIRDTTDTRVGVIRLGFSTDIIKDKVLNAIVQTAVISIISFIIIAILINTLLSRLVSRRIASLAERAEDIAEGQYGVMEAPVNVSDELDSLADSLNQMSLKIQQQIHALQEYQEQLESQVKERTAELLQAQHIAKLGHWRLDISSGKLFWSDEIYRIFGLDSSIEPSFDTFLDTIHPEDREHIHQSYQSHVEKRVPYDIQHRIVTPVGEIKYVREQCETEYDDDGNALRSLGTVQDVTEHVRMQELIMQSEKMLSVGGLAAGMAHELNNPLGGILQGIQNIQRRISTELDKNRDVAQELGIELESIDTYLQQRNIMDFLHGIKEASERAAVIVDNMLKFSRKPQGTLSPEDLVELVDRTLELAKVDYDLKKSYDFKNIEIVRDYDTSTGTVPCIPSEIQQVLLNLLRNAAQAFQATELPADKPRVLLRIHRKGQMACIDVSDNGPGMDEKVRQRVFEPFFTTRKVGEGTGLGLSVSYFIVTQEHRGSLSVASQPGKGATFTLCLPVA